MIYPFKCKKCNTEFTLYMTVKEYTEHKASYFCPNCGSIETKRTFYSDGVSIQFKGEDFTKSVKEE